MNTDFLPELSVSVDEKTGIVRAASSFFESLPFFILRVPGGKIV